MKLLLQQGYNANTADYDKRTALMLAAANGHKVRRRALNMFLSAQPIYIMHLQQSACRWRAQHVKL